MMKSPIKAALLASVASVFLLASCGEAPKSEAPDSAASEQLAPKSIDQLISDHTAIFLQQKPVLASFFGAPVEAVGAPYSHLLPDHSAAGLKATRNAARDAVKAFDAAAASLTDEGAKQNARIVSNIMQYFAGVDGINYGYMDTYFGHMPYVVNQISGPVLDIPKTMAFQMPIKSEADANAFISRLEAFPALLQGISSKMLLDAENGATPPKILVTRALNYLDNFTQAEVRDHFVINSFLGKLGDIEGLSEEARAAIEARAIQAAEAHMYRAYRSLAEDMRPLLDKAGEDAGLWAQPNGEAYYSQLVKFFGDTDLNPDEIHAIGLAEVDRISAEMDALLKASGRSEGSVGKRMAMLAEDPQFLYADSDEGRAKLLNDLNGLIADVYAGVGPYFSTIPPQKVEVRRIPVATQDGEAGGFYTNPSLDGKTPGIYWINLRDMKAVPSFTLNTLTYHEAVPGHHFQIALNMDLKGLPLLRLISSSNAYVEGWALYSENLAQEMGMYDGDPYGNLGRLQDEIFRAVRLVVDTGMHHKRWSREQAIEYMASITGKELSEVTPEIERYMAWPGQALGYKLGMLKIQSMRQKAEKALGDKFDLRGFHDVILLSGSMPMKLIETNVDKWVNSIS